MQAKLYIENLGLAAGFLVSHKKKINIEFALMLWTTL